MCGLDPRIHLPDKMARRGDLGMIFMDEENNG